MNPWMSIVGLVLSVFWFCYLGRQWYTGRKYTKQDRADHDARVARTRKQ